MQCYETIGENDAKQTPVNKLIHSHTKFHTEHLN